ncbi:hypothetical protein NE857_31485 [Nocardiopsis exhalans]|uniref:Uncharacterized protein n=1 Tax=Nocardiopsis exhalans TaxID=163604 RepID=A0ABY5D6S1_9ACTN|nr:hypothetical protein [Nocardiopsis exhalans]USY19702.1 hypothetical protein NE857_31485 [Nocardiopsis exhalans]
MTLDDIRRRVDKIFRRYELRDWENAAAYECRLHRDVLRAIANGSGPPTELAAEALRTTELDFESYGPESPPDVDLRAARLTADAHPGTERSSR